MPVVFFVLLISLFFNFSYASEFFMPEPFNNDNITLSYNEARNYHFSSANIKKYNISSYDEYSRIMEKENSLNLSLDYINLNFSSGKYNYSAFLLIGTSNDAMLRPDGKGAGYLTIWKQQGDKFTLIASNEIYAIYGASLFYDDENNIVVIDSPMGQCEIVFLKTTFYIKNNDVYYNNIEMSNITADNTMDIKTIYNKNNGKPLLLNKYNGLSFLSKINE